MEESNYYILNKKLFKKRLIKISKDKDFITRAGFDSGKKFLKFTEENYNGTKTRRKRNPSIFEFLYGFFFDSSMFESSITVDDKKIVIIRKRRESQLLGEGAYATVRRCRVNGQQAVLRVCDDHDHFPLHQFILYCYSTDQPELLTEYITFTIDYDETDNRKVRTADGKQPLIAGKKRKRSSQGGATPSNPEIKDKPLATAKRYTTLPDLGVSLYDLLDDDVKDKLTIYERLKIFLNIVCRVESLHKAGLSHGDISTSNIMVQLRNPDSGKRELTTQLTDFDSITAVETNKYTQTSFYTAPGGERLEPKERDLVALFRLFRMPYEINDGDTVIYTMDGESLYTGRGHIINTKLSIDPSSHILNIINGRALVDKGSFPYGEKDTDAKTDLADTLDQLVNIIIDYLKRENDLDDVDPNFVTRKLNSGALPKQKTPITDLFAERDENKHPLKQKSKQRQKRRKRQKR